MEDGYQDDRNAEDDGYQEERGGGDGHWAGVRVVKGELGGGEERVPILADGGRIY